MKITLSKFNSDNRGQNIAFSSYYRPQKKLNPEFLQRADYLISIVNDAHRTLSVLNNADNSAAKSLLNLLKTELHLSKFFESKEKTVVFNNGSSNFIITTDGNKVITLSEQNKINGAVEKTIKTSDRVIIDQSESLKNVKNAEEFLQKILDCVDFILLKYRRIMDKSENKLVLQKSIDSIKKPVVSGKQIDGSVDKKVSLSPEILSLVKEIESTYIKIFDRFESIKNPGTRSRWKNEFYNIVKTPRGSRILGFKDDKFNMFINYTNDHLKRYLVLQYVYDDQTISNIILAKDGAVYKHKMLSCLKDTASEVEYYAQEEVDSPDFKTKLLLAKKNLSEYLDYLEERMDLKDKRMARLSTAEVGVIPAYVLDLCNQVKKSYKESKEAFSSIHDPDLRKSAKDFFNVYSKAGSPSFILRNITSKNEDLQISFPVINKIECLKILVLEGFNSIKESHFIMEDKLVKFEAKSLGRSKKADNKFNFYSQEEIDAFNLEEYLNVSLARLQKITKGIYNKEYKKYVNKGV